MLNFQYGEFQAYEMVFVCALFRQETVTYV
jgi:hypothetical protein